MENDYYDNMLNEFVVDERIICLDTNNDESNLLEFERVYIVKESTSIFQKEAVELEGFNEYAVYLEERFMNATLWKLQCSYIENVLEDLGIYIK